jgi:peptidoglycan/LPS O-acetylase OafA/YrhL
VNIALFGQDWIMFLAVNRNNLQFSADFSNSTVPLYNGLLVHQAWTLGLELSFYAIAPFILKKRKLIVGLIFLSLLLRLSLCILGIGRHDPWTYRFFPCELALFLLGALSHQFILPFFRVRPFFMKTGADYGTYFLLLLTIFYTAIPIPEPYKEICFYMVFAMLIPLAFVYQNRTAFDRLIGELSYSIYVVHTLVIAFIFRAALSIGFNNRHFLAICCVVVSILAASALVVFVGGPLEKIRTRFRRRREAGVAT